MKQKDTMQIQTLPGGKNAEFVQRESEITHTSYADEVAFFTLIEQGATEEVMRMFQKFIQPGVVAGRLSDDPVRQMKYFAVCCVTLGTRYAIRGGLAEMRAYRLSDECIHSIDGLSSPEAIASFLGELVPELTNAVRESKRTGCPPQIRKALDYIDRHLHEPIQNSEVAAVAGIQVDYFAKLFKKYVGQTVQNYIMSLKLNEAKCLLERNCDQRMLGYYLGFSSQTYFITCFRKAYGITPHRYAEKF